MSTLTLRARHLLPGPDAPALPDAAVVVRDGSIAEVRRWREAEPTGTVVDVDGVLAPGMVDAHSHLRGIPLPAHGIPPRPFESWIVSLASATALPPADEALVAASELLETGVTAVQGFVDAGSGADPLAQARAAVDGIARSGIRALVVLGFADRALTRPEPPVGDWARVPAGAVGVATREVRALVATWLASPVPGTVTLGVGPVGAQWSSDELLAALAEEPTARRHTHLHESRMHRDWLDGHAAPVDRLHAAGLLDSRMSGAHAVHLTDAELDRLAASGVSLVHCPASNAALGVGTARVRAWLDRGIPAGLGIDSQNLDRPDVFDVMRAAGRTAVDVGAPLSAPEVLALATTGGARALGIRGGGLVAPGSPADLVELDLDEASAEAIVETGSRRSVRRVWVAGEPVVAAGRAITDTTPSRSLLATRLAADADARAARQAAAAETVELVRLLAGGGS